MERNQAISDEVGKLLEAKMVQEVQYLTWLAYLVIVKKSRGDRWMCIDYNDLNKPQRQYYPLPRINALVDSVTGNDMLYFIDAFKRYHQSGISKENQEKTAFIIDRGFFWYTTMLFGLKNTGVTYQCLVNKIFDRQIGRNMEAYIDDMLVKSRTIDTFISDLREVFQVLH